jgi:CRISPR/Cas system CSM-associated protein Csm3 (group 7 of RAMP superfamily)
MLSARTFKRRNPSNSLKGMARSHKPPTLNNREDIRSKAIHSRPHKRAIHNRDDNLHGGGVELIDRSIKKPGLKGRVFYCRLKNRARVRLG